MIEDEMENKKVKTIYIAPKFKRFVAYIIDIVPITVLVFVLFINFTSYSVLYKEYTDLILSGKEYTLDDLNKNFLNYTNYINMISIVIFGLYSAYMETTLWRGTLGKKLMNIGAGDFIGQPLDGEIAFKRNVIKILILSFIPILMIWILFDKRNRGVHDVMSKTLVVSMKYYRSSN